MLSLVFFSTFEPICLTLDSCLQRKGVPMLYERAAKEVPLRSIFPFIVTDCNRSCTILCNAQEVHVIFAASPCSLASDQFRNILKSLHGTLCHMARSIPGTCLLARARGNEKVLYAIWQEVLRAHAFLARARGNEQELYAIWQEGLRAHAFSTGIKYEAIVLHT